MYARSRMEPNDQNRKRRRDKPLDDSEEAKRKRARQAEYNRRYRERKKQEALNNSDDTKHNSDETKRQQVRNAEKNRKYRERKRAEIGVIPGPSTSTSVSVTVNTDEGFVEIDRERLLTLCEFAKWLNFQRDDAYKRYWVYAEERFENTFGCLCFNDPCSVCDRLWSDTQF